MEGSGASGAPLCGACGMAFALQILPASVKGVAGSLVVLTNWFLCFTITQTFPFLLALSPFGAATLLSQTPSQLPAFVHRMD